MIEAPIFHVNGDDPEAVVFAARVATEFRQQFQKPVVIDMFCYRRHGHNEADEPLFTQPAMYKRIKSHPTVVDIYSKNLIDEGVITEAEFGGMKDEVRTTLDKEFSFSDGYKPNKADWLDGRWSGITRPDSDDWRGNTGVEIETLKDIGHRITTIPNDFHIHKTVGKLVERRREMIDTGQGIDWAMAEHMAFASLLMEGFRVRLSGQDCERGTFSQRHAVFIDQENERRFAPLKHLSPNQARFEVINSMLSEEAVLGFEYGYSLAEPNALTLWEAQFGDFANGAQVVFDPVPIVGRAQMAAHVGSRLFVAARLRRARVRSTLRRASSAICSSAPKTTGRSPTARRLRTISTSCAVSLHRNFRKPLILMTPKSLLRHKRVVSKIEDFGPTTSFHRLLWDDAERGTSSIELKPDAEIKRVVICTGKVYYDLLEGSREAWRRRRLSSCASSSSIHSRRAPSSTNSAASSSPRSSGARRSRRTWVPGISWTPTSSGF